MTRGATHSARVRTYPGPRRSTWVEARRRTRVRRARAQRRRSPRARRASAEMPPQARVSQRPTGDATRGRERGRVETCERRATTKRVRPNARRARAARRSPRHGRGRTHERSRRVASWMLPCLAELQICPARTLNKSDRQDVDRDVPNCTRGCRGTRSARAIREMDRGGAASESVCSIAPRPPPGRHPGRSAHASWREALDRIRLSRSATVEPPSRARPAPFCVADGIVSERDPFSRIR